MGSPTRAAIIGSRDFPLDECSEALVRFIDALGPAVVLTRGSEGFDKFVSVAAVMLRMQQETFPGKGGPSNYERDVALAAAADHVYAFFHPDHIGEGGTQHVVDKALDQGKPVSVYTVIDGEIRELGGSSDM